MSDIALTTVEGSGTLSNPYVVNSTADFIFLSKNVMQDKHIVINCDITLNEEVFDEYGNISGGDGAVYSWATNDYKGAYIDGRGHTISGMYISNIDSVRNGLFHNSVVAEIKNWTASNFYIYSGDYAGVFGVRTLVLKNVKTKKCYIHGTRFMGGLVYRAENVEECESGTYLFNGSQATGGIMGVCVDSSIINTKFYGKIDCLEKKTAVGIGGIIGNCSGKVRIKNCENYAYVFGGTNGTGGIIGASTMPEYEVQIENCTNYGDVVTDTSGNNAGIMGRIEGSLVIINCANYGKVYTKQKTSDFEGSVLVGRVMVYNGRCTKVVIKNCKGVDYFGNPIVFKTESPFSAEEMIIVIDNVDVKYKCKKLAQRLIIWSNSATCAITKISNINLEIEADSCVFNLISWYRQKNTVELKNIYIHIKTKNYKGFGLLSTNLVIDFVCEGVLLDVDNNGKIVKNYYGSDFSGYYCDWKTGNLGLKAMSGKGFFQQSVTEEMIVNKGFTKKEA